MRANLKYLSIGLLVGGGMTAVVLLSAFLLSRSTRGAYATPLLASTQSATDTPLFALPTFTPLLATPTPATWNLTPETWNLTPGTPPPVPPTHLPDSLLASQIASILPDYGGDWNLLIRAGGERDMVAINADRVNHVASIIKVPIAMLFFKVIEARGISTSDYYEYLSTRGVGRTYMQLLTAMLVESEEDATGTMKEIIYDSKIDVDGLLAKWGAPHTDLGNRHSTPRDIAALYETLYFGNVITPEGRAILLDLLAAYTPNDDIRLGVLRPSLPAGAEFYNKRGTVTKDRLIVGDSALLAWDSNGTRRVYVIVTLAYGADERPTTNVRLDRGIEAIARLFWDFVHS
ncbi:MAG: serine hydrolase [Chloroflexota bacterium]